MNDRFDYSVPLCEIQSDAQFCQWISHLAEKTWVTDSDMGAFVKAIDWLGYRNLPNRE